MKNLPVLVFRTDANVHTGSGHFMRCVAVAQAAARNGAKPIFVSAKDQINRPSSIGEAGVGDWIDRTIREFSGHHLKHSFVPGSHEDARFTVSIAKEQKASHVILDGYHFETEYQRILKENGVSVAAFDDFRYCDAFIVDYLINYNLHASSKDYPSVPTSTKLILGPKFAPLRREFSDFPIKRDPIRPVRTILVTLGGLDSPNATEKVMRAMDELEDDIKVNVIVGPQNPNLSHLKRLADSHSRFEIRQDISNMAEVMAEADLAISASGSTVWELAYLGVPSLLLITAENQRLIAQSLDDAGVFQSLGDNKNLSSHDIAEATLPLLKNRDTRAAMSKKAQALVDGQGAMRIAQELL